MVQIRAYNYGIIEKSLEQRLKKISVTKRNTFGYTIHI